MHVTLKHIDFDVECRPAAGSWRVLLHVHNLDREHIPWRVCTEHMEVATVRQWEPLLGPDRVCLPMHSDEEHPAHGARCFAHEVAARFYCEALLIALFAWNDAPQAGDYRDAVAGARICLRHIALDLIVQPERGPVVGLLNWMLHGSLLRMDGHTPCLPELYGHNNGWRIVTGKYIGYSQAPPNGDGYLRLPVPEFRSAAAASDGEHFLTLRLERCWHNDTMLVSGQKEIDNILRMLRNWDRAQSISQ